MVEPTPDVAALKAMACQAVDAWGAELLALSRQIHGDPELAFEEFRSAAKIADLGEALGLPVERRAFGLDTALRAECGSDGATVAILSEYDALPGIGHACGHNIIAATGLGAALALNSLGRHLPGRVRWIGAPAEERGCGKELLARAGAFDDVDAAMMVHPAGVNAKAVRTLCIADCVVTFHGHAAHAAVAPYLGRNALDAAVLAYQALAALRQHLRPNEFLNGIITHGGDAPNIIPDRAELAYFVRAPTAQRLAALKVKFEGAMKAGALTAGCEVDVAWAAADYLDFRLNAPLADAYEANATAFERDFFPVEQLRAGGTDMGNVSHRVPSLHPLIAAAPARVMIHDPEFATWAASSMGDRAVIDGAKALAMTAIDVFTDASLRHAMREAFAAHAAASADAISKAWRADAPRLGRAGCC